QYGINITVLIFNNKRWGAIRDHQDKSYGGRRFEVELLNPDFVKLAEAYGAIGLRVDDPKDFSSVVEQALAADRITVVDIPMEDED
ncbi:MAG: thiamine pyrophosphate-dependent enzyme, partial [Dehalococcoidia bacterium]|nr:thiamine pyrophosphate-dependent enzyme [Dehalococcoidia bacterium]